MTILSIQVKNCSKIEIELFCSALFHTGLKEFGILVYHILCALCRLLVHASTTKKLAPQQYFSVSHAPYCAPYCTPYREDFKFICLQISYDLMYLKLFIYYLPFLQC